MSGTQARRILGLEIGAVDGRLCQPVRVDQSCVRAAERLEERVALAAPRFGADDDDTHEVESSAHCGDMVKQQCRHRRHELGTVDLLLDHQGVQARRVHQDRQRAEHEPAAREQRTDEVTREDVEREARHLKMRGDVLQSVRFLVGEVRVRQTAIRDQCALRLSGRSARVDDVGEIVAGRRRRGIQVGLVREIVPVDDDSRRRLEGRKLRQLAGMADHCRGLGVVEHELDAVRRIERIDRHVGSAGLDYREHGDHEVERLVHEDRDQRVRYRRPALAAGEQAGSPAG